jgi:glutaconyl-CoA/methylmalonyl-CoA decarboxylase subunit gamma
MRKFSFTINGLDYDIDIISVDDNMAEVEVNGYKYQVEFDRTVQTTKTPKLVRSEPIPSTDITKTEQKTSSPGSQRRPGFIKSPLPGIVREIFVNVGDEVKIGDKILILEAMKMENIINSDKEGKIVAINTQNGDSVMEGETLIVIGE